MGGLHKSRVEAEEMRAWMHTREQSLRGDMSI
jgi:hypothetical protein